MCGIAGIFSPEALDGLLSGLRAMVDAKRQRGPGADGQAPDQRACVGRDPPGGDTVRSTQPLQVGLPAMSEVILEEANGSSTASQVPGSE